MNNYGCLIYAVPGLVRNEELSISKEIEFYSTEVLTTVSFDAERVDLLELDRKLSAKEFIQVDCLECFSNFMLPFSNRDKSSLEDEYKNVFHSKESIRLEFVQDRLMECILRKTEDNSLRMRNCEKIFLKNACEVFKEPKIENLNAIIAAIRLSQHIID